MSTCIDLKGCNPKTIRDTEKVREFVDRLCKLIGMRKFGETVVVDFGDDPRVTGFSMAQLIETSLISGHFGNEHTRFVYLDIFSCKEYEPHKAATFAKEFFEAEDCEVKTIFRH